jgi:HEPN domain-containing protein
MPPRDLMEEVAAWIGKAESDLKAIRLMLPAADALLDIVCYHAQQAAEKYLKALLIFYGIPFRRTHDLEELRRLLPSSSSVPAEVGDLSGLTVEAAESRYPDIGSVYDRKMAEDAGPYRRTGEVIGSRRTALPGLCGTSIGFGSPRPLRVRPLPVSPRLPLSCMTSPHTVAVAPGCYANFLNEYHGLISRWK